MRKELISKIGGIVSFISVFLPVLSFELFENIFYYWIFGQVVQPVTDGASDEPVYWFQYIDFFGTIIMMLIIVCAMQIILKASIDSKVGLIAGIIIIISMISYFAIVNTDLVNRTSESLHIILQLEEDIEFVPSYGYYTAIIGGIVSIIGSIIPNKKNIMEE